MRLLLASAALLVLATAPAQADEDPIDKALRACLATEQAQSDLGIIDCTGTAITAWDARLNKNYQAAMASLDPQSQALLRASERKWVAWRAAEDAAQAGAWRNDRGSIISVEQMDDTLNAIKERAAELTTYISD
jgi:uncharacterized protein YecT (DUF1311 family)